MKRARTPGVIPPLGPAPSPASPASRPAGSHADVSTLGAGFAQKTVGWHPLSPGTGGNLHALALPPNEPSAIWVGSDNGGMMLGARSSSGAWSFQGAQRGLTNPDIASVHAAETIGGVRLAYTVDSSNYGGIGLADRRIFHWNNIDRWSPVALSTHTHVWSSVEKIPTTDSFPAQPTGLPITPGVQFSAPSHVRVMRLQEGSPHRHLVVIASPFTKTAYSSEGRISLWSDPVKGYEISGKTVTPYAAAPSFYACIAQQLTDGTFGFGEWVGATYGEDSAVWSHEGGPTSGWVGYRRPSGIGSLWLDPVVQSGGAVVNLYFTVSLGIQAGSDDEPRTEIGRLSIRIPSDGLTFDPVTDPTPTLLPLQFSTVLSLTGDMEICQVAGVRRPGKPLQLVYTTASKAPEAAIASLIQQSNDSGWTPQPESIPLPSSARHLFFCVSNSAGWAYAASCPNPTTTGIPTGLWRRDPATGSWSVCTFIAGAGNPPNRSVDYVANLPEHKPIQLAVGMVLGEPFAGGKSNRPEAVVAAFYDYTLVNSATAIRLLPTDSEIFSGVRWRYYGLPAYDPNIKVTPQSPVQLRVTVAVVASQGEASVSIRARYQPRSGCPVLDPVQWSHLLKFEKQGQTPLTTGSTTGSRMIAGVRPAGEPLVAIVLTDAPQTPPNMNRSETWRSRFGDEDEAYDVIAVAADPQDGGKSHRIALQNS